MLEWIISIATFIVIIYLIVKKPAYAIVLLLFYYSIIDVVLEQIGVEGFRLIIRYFLFLLLIFIHYKPKIWNANIQYFLHNKIVLGLLILTATIFFYSYINTDVHEALRIEFFRDFLIYTFIPFIVTILIIDKEDKLQEILFALVFIGIIYFIIFYFNTDISQIEIDERRTITQQGINTIGLSRISGVIFIISYFNTSFSKKRFKRYLFIAVTVVSGFMLLVAKQRGTIIGVALAVIILSFFVYEKKFKLRIYISIMLALILFVTDIIDIQRFGVIERFSELSSYEDFQRYKDYFNTWKIFTQNPFTGLGPKGYYIETGRIYPHNMFLELIAEYGLIGIICIVLIFFTAIRYNIRILRSKNVQNNYKILSSLWILLLVSVSVSGNIVYNNRFWILTGLIMLLYKFLTYDKKLRIKSNKNY